ncbi:MAG: hypothetical protein P8Y94_14725, partial [Acidobacteriota bacterium]
MATASLRRRSKSSWTVVLSWYETDSEGRRKRVQRMTAVKGNKAKAKERMTEILAQKNSGLYVEPSKLTVGEWLDFWVENRIQAQCRLRTFEGYKSIINVHMKPAIGVHKLQELTSLHLEEYYREKSKDQGETKALSQTTLEHHHAVISGALKWALKKGLIVKNVAQLVDNRPSAPVDRNEAKQHCWTAEEARTFLETAKTFGAQPAAFYALALETGMRKGELC